MTAEGAREVPLESLSRGLAVLELFDGGEAFTSSEVAVRLGLTRATARRILLTLETLGHLRSDGRRYELGAGALDLGWAHLAHLRVNEILHPHLTRLVHATRLPSFASVLAVPDVVFVDRVQPPAPLSMTSGRGSVLPAHASPSGLVLLAHLPMAGLDAYLADGPLPRLTARTVVEPDAVRDRLAAIRAAGWAVVDGELDSGLRSLACPVRGATGEVVAAVSVSTTSLKTSMDELTGPIRERVARTAGEIGEEYARAAAS